MFDSLKFDQAGNRIFPGKTVRVLNWDIFTDTALPSWLTFTNGDSSNLTLTVSSMANLGQDGRATLQWSGTPSNVAVSSIKTAFAIDCRQFQEIGILFKDLTFGTSLDATNKLDCKITMSSATCGAWYRQNSTTQVMECRIFNSTGTDDFSPIPYQVCGNSFGNGRKQLGMCMNIHEKSIYLLGNEDVPVDMKTPVHPNATNSSWPTPTSAGAMINPGIEFINSIAAADGNAWIRFSGVKLWVVTG